MDILAIIERGVSLLSIPLIGLTLFGLIRQMRKEQPLRISTPLVGLVMAPATLLVNLIFLNQAFSIYLAPALLILGLGFGLTWGQTNRLYQRGETVVGKRSILHLVFWGISYAITQLLAVIAPLWLVAGGLAAMFFSTGSTLGTNLNLFVRLLRFRRPFLQVPVPTPAGPPSHSTKKCSRCGAENLSNKRFCTQCGARLPDKPVGSTA